MSFHKLLAKKLAPEAVKRLIEQEVANILRTCQPEAVILFGSAALGKMTDSSDLDFVVIFAEASQVDSSRRNYYCSSHPRTWPVDILFIDREDFERKSRLGGVYLIAAQEGKIVYLVGDSHGAT
jgi:predicted nucleotidyltransferase